VGIAEQHALTSAAGLAMGGLHPVVALYSTFLNRAFDQLLMDVALHGKGVTLVLDRAGVTGSDGPSHNGMWDLSLLGIVPGMRVAAPRDAPTLREELAEAVTIDDGPTAIRFPKGSVIESVPAVRRVGGVDGGGVDVLHEPQADEWWVLPVPEALVGLARQHQLVVTVTDCGRHGGFGSALAHVLSDAECDVPLRDLAIPQRFLDHGSRADVLAAAGLTAQDVARRVTEWAAALPGDVGSAQPAHSEEEAR
jgi:1-deoxy-D-xylulose-5-phosphate synthase